MPYVAGEIINFEYTGSAQMVTLQPGRYKLETWGAQGGYRSSSSYGGKGGYSVGELSLMEDTVLYVYSGGAGNTGGTAGGFNGGGLRNSYRGGGGATDIRLRTDDLLHRVIVAGGGGSDGASNKSGGYGGGESGQSRTDSYGSGGYGGTQTGVASSSWQTSTRPTGTTSQSYAYAGFGFGGNGIYYADGYGGAGGGGWYGGSGAYPDGSGDDDRGGGGGSGFVWTGANAPTGYGLTDADKLTNASTTAGNVSFTSPTGASETGHSGDGYARITVLEIYKFEPEQPGNFRQVSKTYFEIGLAWDAADRAEGYRLYKGGALLAQLTGTAYTDSGMLPAESHEYTLIAYNAEGDSAPAVLIGETEFAYYYSGPKVDSASLTPNPVSIGGEYVVSIAVSEEFRILEPVFFMTGEIYAGEIT